MVDQSLMRLAALALLSVVLVFAYPVRAQSLHVTCVPGSDINVSGGTGNSGCATKITPIVSASSESTHIIKAAPGTLISLTFTNGGSNAGYVMVLNQTTVPAGSATVTPLDCVAVAASSTATINYNGGPPNNYSTGIVAVASASGGSCFTYTTASQPAGFFSARVE